MKDAGPRRRRRLSWNHLSSLTYWVAILPSFLSMGSRELSNNSRRLATLLRGLPLTSWSLTRFWISLRRSLARIKVKLYFLLLHCNIYRSTIITLFEIIQLSSTSICPLCPFLLFLTTTKCNLDVLYPSP